MSSSFWTGNQDPLGKRRRKVHTSSTGLTSQRKTSPSWLHAMSCRCSTPVPAGWSHICDKVGPGLPAATAGAVTDSALKAALGSPEKSLAAGICPRGQSCTSSCSAATSLAGEQNHTQLAAHPASRQGAPQQCAGHRHPQLSFTGSKGKLFHVWFHRGVNRRAAVANVCVSCGGSGLLCKGSGSAGTCAACAVHKPICNSHLQRDDIPAPGEGSFAQSMLVTSILCWLIQGGAGQPAASPGAWKRPRCQCWCESGSLCPPHAAPAALVSNSHPALPQVPLSRAQHCKSC